MAVWAIGDIQGCYDSLKALLKKIDFDVTRDKLWIAGDLVNRGEGSLETLKYLYSIKENVEIVLGIFFFMVSKSQIQPLILYFSHQKLKSS